MSVFWVNAELLQGWVFFFLGRGFQQMKFGILNLIKDRRIFTVQSVLNLHH